MLEDLVLVDLPPSPSTSWLEEHVDQQFMIPNQFFCEQNMFINNPWYPTNSFVNISPLLIKLSLDKDTIEQERLWRNCRLIVNCYLHGDKKVRGANNQWGREEQRADHAIATIFKYYIMCFLYLHHSSMGITPLNFAGILLMSLLMNTHVQ